MGYKSVLLVFSVFSVFDHIGAYSGSIENCLKADSISCIQMEIYKTAKTIFDKSNIEMLGISVNRRGKSLEKTEMENKILTSTEVVTRQVALENYIFGQLKTYWNEAQISWNPTVSARSLASSLVDDIKPEMYNNINGEARGKAKKQLRILLPLLIGIKLKLATFAALSYMIIAVVAKKAVLAGLISLLVSAFIATKNLLEAKHAAHSTPYSSAYDQAALWQYDNNVADTHQQVAYSTKNEKAK